MKLMRNTAPDGQCKYAAVRMDKIATMNESDRASVAGALRALELFGVLENPKPGEPEEFFLMKLKDPRTKAALHAYAAQAMASDPEFAAEVRQLAERAGESSPWCKVPD